MEKTKYNLFSMAQEQLNECAKILNLDKSVYDVLASPMREIHISLPVKMDDGTVKVFHGYRVQHNNALGPTKGGIRFHPEETIDTIRALASWMTWKCSLMGLPLGGAKGGIICNPKEMSDGEIERLSRTYVDMIYKYIGPEEDVPAPDVYTNPRIMAWMMDEYSKIAQKNQFGTFTGKPIVIGGSAGREQVTAKGGLYTLKEAASEFGIDLSRTTIAIQGYGNAGYYAGVLAKEMFGCKVVAVSDSKGAIFNKDGIGCEKVNQHKKKTGSVKGFPGTKEITQEELLSLDVDILILAALEMAVNKENASSVKAKIIMELANGPTTPDADKILYEKGIHVIPDLVCSAGGVTVSYFEMVQNFMMLYWSEKEVDDRLSEKMKNAYHNVLDTSKRLKINMRQAAYVIAVQRVIEAMKLRGWV